MFILTDCTTAECPIKKYVLNDITDIGDIVIGITGREDIANKAMHDASNMIFGDTIINNPYYILDCVMKGENNV